MAEVDKHNRFAEEVFTFRVNKDNKVFISYQGKQISILKGKEATKFLSKVDGQDNRTTQLEMARVTGNFKRGNERNNK
ncbi:MAG: hypothetical protein GY839_21585 [candidate division Zixibacteria bacterium]|nr:hypothetical protein [candidate division Zixibacteria bacterium]